MKKKIFLIVICGVMLAVLAGCKNSSSLGNDKNNLELNNTVYLGGSNGKLLKTKNGTKWEEVELPSNNNINSSELIIKGMKYLNGEYLLYTIPMGKNGGSSTRTILYKSSNGKDWELSLQGSFLGNWQSVDYINNKYYVLGGGFGISQIRLTTGDNINNAVNDLIQDDLFENWNAYVKDYAYGNNKFVVHVERDKKYYENSDTITKYFYVGTPEQGFTKYDANISLDVLESGNGVYVGIDAFDRKAIYNSVDGINWTKVLDFDSSSLRKFGVIYRDNKFYLWYNDIIYTSSDGINWNEFYKNTDKQGIIAFDYRNGTYVYTSLFTEKDPKTYESIHTFKIFISANGTDWVESSFKSEDYNNSSIYITEK